MTVTAILMLAGCGGEEESTPASPTTSSPLDGAASNAVSATTRRVNETLEAVRYDAEQQLLLFQSQVATVRSAAEKFANPQFAALADPIDDRIVKATSELDQMRNANDSQAAANRQRLQNLFAEIDRMITDAMKQVEAIGGSPRGLPDPSDISPSNPTGPK